MAGAEVVGTGGAGSVGVGGGGASPAGGGVPTDRGASADRGASRQVVRLVNVGRRRRWTKLIGAFVLVGLLCVVAADDAAEAFYYVGLMVLLGGYFGFLMWLVSAIGAIEEAPYLEVGGYGLGYGPKTLVPWDAVTGVERRRPILRWKRQLVFRADGWEGLDVWFRRGARKLGLPLSAFDPRWTANAELVDLLRTHLPEPARLQLGALIGQDWSDRPTAD